MRVKYPEEERVEGWEGGTSLQLLFVKAKERWPPKWTQIYTKPSQYYFFLLFATQREEGAGEWENELGDEVGIYWPLWGIYLFMLVGELGTVFLWTHGGTEWTLFMVITWDCDQKSRTLEFWLGNEQGSGI